MLICRQYSCSKAIFPLPALGATEHEGYNTSMKTRRAAKATARKLIYSAFGVLLVGLVTLFLGGTTLPQWVLNLLIPGVPIVFIALVMAGLWMQVDPKRHG